MDATFVVTALQFLLSLYSEFRKRHNDAPASTPDPDRLGELIEEVRADPEPAWDEVRLQRRIEEKFPADEAKRVKEDLALFNLVAEPPQLEKFDYWSLLGKYALGLQKLAAKAELFKLRGRKTGIGLAIDLPRTAGALLSDKRARAGIMPHPNEGANGAKSISALFVESQTGFPIRVIVTAVFEEYGHTGYGSSSFHEDGSVYNINVGQQRHWLRFDPHPDAHRFRPFEFMLTSADLKAIVEAFRDDIRGCIAEVRSDITAVEPLFEQVDLFLKNIA